MSAGGIFRHLVGRHGPGKIARILLPLPLLFPAILIVVAIVDAVEFKRYGGGWPSMTVPDFVNRQRLRVENAFIGGFRAEENASIPVFGLFVPRNTLERMDHNLPASGFEEQIASLETALGFHKVRVRYRGDNSFHWFFPKRSWRLKTDKDKPLFYGREFDLVNAKDAGHLIQVINSWVASRLDLLTTQTFFAQLNLNNRYQGLYLYQELNDESFLRNHSQMPGDIYAADSSMRRLNWRHDRDQEEKFDYFRDPYAWDKAASCNGPTSPGPSPLAELLEQLYSHRYWDSAYRFVDEAYMARFCALISLIGTYHYDTWHNVRLYLDPLSGKFKMIEKDSTGFNFDPRFPPERSGLDITSNLLFDRLHRNPEFVFEKYQALYEVVLGDAALDELQAMISATGEQIHDADELDQLDRIGFNRRDPDSSSREEAELLNNWVTARAQSLKERLGDARLSYVQQKNVLKIDVDGYASCRRVRIECASRLPDDFRIYRDVDFNGRLDRAVDVIEPIKRVSDYAFELEAILHPGRYEAGFGRDYQWFFVPAALSYVYLVEPGQALDVQAVTGENAITGAPLAASAGTTWEVPACASRHPWSFPDPATEPVQDPVRRVTEDWVIPQGQTVELAGGTELRMDPGVSIFCYGRLLARGSATKPIRVQASTPGAPWGVIALIGEGASGSVFEHVKFSSGSDAYHRRVYYSGMVSAHYCRGVVFSNCTFESNRIGDDALRAGKAEVDLVDCRFLECEGDAVDYDYSSGRIVRCDFQATGNDAIDLMSSAPIIAHNTISGAGDKGVSVGENSRPVIVNTRIDDAAIGIQVKDGSEPIIAHCDIRARDSGVHANVKNWRYGDGGHPKIYNTVIRGGRVTVEADVDSMIQLYACAVLTNSTPISGGVSTMDTVWLNVDSASDVDQNPHAEIQDLLGLPRELFGRIGLGSDSSTVPRFEVLLDDRFPEDFTLFTSGWQAEGAVHQLRKVDRYLRASAVRGGEAWLVKSMSNETTGAEFLGIETFSRRRKCDVTITLVGEGTQTEVVNVDTRMREHMIRITIKRVDRVSISLPEVGNELLIRRVRLLVGQNEG